MTLDIVITTDTEAALASELAGIPAGVGATAGAGEIAGTAVSTEATVEGTVPDSTTVSMPDLITDTETLIALQVVELEITIGTEAEDMPAM